MNGSAVTLKVSDSNGSCKLFRVPFAPWLPALGMLLNYMLITQISWGCATFMLIYICTGLVWYACYGVWHTEAASRQWINSTSKEQDTTERISSSNSEEHEIAEISCTLEQQEITESLFNYPALDYGSGNTIHSIANTLTNR